MSNSKRSTKSIRNEEARRRQMPVDQWLSHVGFTDEQIRTMKVESAARLASLENERKAS